MTHITPISAFNDNYIWAIHSIKGSDVAIVDPGDASVVLRFLKENELSINAILITHHHWDHTNGLEELIHHNPNALVYGPSTIKEITHPVTDGDTFFLESQQLHLTVHAVPGHTLDHIAYYGGNLLFCGDTLFSAGCGRVFEGTFEQMFHSLEKLSKLPANTLVYCGHEYTMSNLKFAQALEPDNSHVAEHVTKTNLRLQAKQPSLPSTIGLEKTINPFLRCSDAQFRKAIEERMKRSPLTPIECYTTIRKMKDTF